MTRRFAATTGAARSPDDRAVVGCAVTALAALILMLLAGSAEAEQPEVVCWNLENGALECESRASIGADCAAIGQKHEFCAAVQSSRSPTPLHLPGNTTYTAVKPTSAGKEFWSRTKPHVN